MITNLNNRNTSVIQWQWFELFRSFALFNRSMYSSWNFLYYMSFDVLDFSCVKTKECHVEVSQVGSEFEFFSDGIRFENCFETHILLQVGLDELCLILQLNTRLGLWILCVSVWRWCRIHCKFRDKQVTCKVSHMIR